MKIPMKWLKEYTDLDLPVSEYASRMIMAGNGVEGWAQTGEQFDGVVVGHVLTCEPHPNSDHLHVCQVDVGQAEPIQIVCGAPNVYAGAYVAAALIGAKLPGGSIKKGKLRGVESFGMLCSGPELDVPDGLYPHCGDEGILLFEEAHQPGTNVKDIFGLGDIVVDFEILANRPDCLSVWGMARETAAVFDTHFVMPEIDVVTGGGDIANYANVMVEDDVLCPRYCARVVRNVRVARSPQWLREYLYGAGVRPINNIVDITNFIMLETGHPMHAFDLNKVRDRTIVVRRALPDETLVTLDGKTHLLNPDMLVIADAERATGLAGIMGGEESEITGETREVLFECAAFDRTNNRLTSRALGIRTESSSRFEKGVRPETALLAIERACMLIHQLECGEVVDGVIDLYPHPADRHIVEASVARIRKLISVPVSGEEMVDLLARLGMDASLDGDTLTCVAPPFRSDIETEADLAEEVLRLHGYDDIPSTLMSGVTMAGERGARQSLSDRIKTHLIGLKGFETINYSFISPKWLANLGLADKDPRLDPVELRNPLGEDTSVLRTSLVPSLLNTVSLNLNRGTADARLFEVAPVFSKTTDGALPDENWMIALAFYGDEEDFYSLRESVASLLSIFGIESKIHAGADVYYHPGRCATLTCGETILGQLGEIHPDVAGNFSIEKRVYVAELSLVALQTCERPIGAVKPLPKFPTVERDLAVVVSESVATGDLLDTLIAAGGRLLESAKLFDLYRGAQLGAEQKSAAFSLSFRAADHTLTEPEITAEMDKLLHALEKAYDAKRRD